MKANRRGFTLIELLVVLVVLGVLTALVVPSFTVLMAKRAVQAAAAEVAADLRLARSEAVKRSGYVTVCRSVDADTCAGAGSWHTGWVVFLDKDGDGTKDAGDTILRVHQELSGVLSMGNDPDLSTTKPALTFRPNGLGIGINDTWMVTARASRADGVGRLMCISSQGRLTLREPGATAC